jgi:hypothetical protein
MALRNYFRGRSSRVKNFAVCSLSISTAADFRTVVVFPGLPDGSFSYQKSKFGKILESLGMENVGIFWGHLEYCSHTWYNNMDGR